MKIAILDDYQNAVEKLDCYALLSEHEVTVFNHTFSSAATLAKAVYDYDVLVLIRERTQINRELLARLPNLKLISQTGKISQHLDISACREYGVAVCEGRGSPIAPSELCWSLIMAASRHLPAYVQNLENGVWQSSGALGLGRSLNGLTLGIWGYGKIGQKIAQFGQAFGMKVLVWGREASLEKALEDGFNPALSKADFFQNSDVLSLHLRLHPSTRACVKEEDLALMKADSLFVNTSRAELVEKGALLSQLKAQPNKAAALDVYDVEPATHLMKGSETQQLIQLENVLASPHLGYVEQNSYELYFKIAFNNVLAYAKGEPENLLD